MQVDIPALAAAAAAASVAFPVVGEGEDIISSLISELQMQGVLMIAQHDQFASTESSKSSSQLLLQFLSFQGAHVPCVGSPGVRS